MRRRTVCVYCGERISGVLPERHSTDPTRDRDLRFAARTACERHLELALREWYSGLPSPQVAVEAGDEATP